MGSYKSVVVSAGKGGWGGPLTITPTDDLKNNGFTFGYAIKRKEIGADPRPAGTIYWSGATGPIFFIDPKNELVAMVLYQRPSTFPTKIRTDFKTWVMTRTHRLPLDASLYFDGETCLMDRIS